MKRKNDTISVKVDLSTKTKANKVFKNNNLNMSSACRLFLMKCIEANGIPFDVTYEPKRRNVKKNK